MHSTPGPQNSSATGAVTLETAMTASRNHFDFLRLFFAALVLYSHCFILVPNGANYRDVLNFTHGQTYPAEVAVNGFFLISGFLITMSWTRSKSLGQFLKKRALRIYPGFIVACLFCAFVAGPLGSASASEYYAHLQHQTAPFLFNVATLGKLHLPPTFLSNPSPDVNGALWTIRVEFECYLLVPFLALIGALRRRGITLGLVLVCWLTYAAISLAGDAALSRALPNPALSESLTTHARFVTYFAAGMVFYLFRDRIRIDSRWVWTSLAALAITGLVGGFNVVAPIAVSYLVMAFAWNQRVRGVPHFGKNLDLSYGLYLYAWPVKQLLVLTLGAKFNPYTLFALALPVTLLLAAGSWYGVEQPFLRLREKGAKVGAPQTA